MSITIRPYHDGDAHDIAELYRRHPDNPNPVDGGVSGTELACELSERETATFLVAEDEGRVVGTFGLFHSTGRRCARAGELIADMFFVAPAYRNGVLTGRLFTEAVEQMIKGGCLVLRLTVNPANAVAFKLYRRVGCVSVGQVVPGEDGNIELHNYLPLILRSVYPDLGPEVRRALGGMSSFGGVTEARDDQLRSDVTEVDGVRTVRYSMAAPPYHLNALVDVDRGAVVQAELAGPGPDDSRPLRITAPPYQVAPALPARAHRFGGAGVTCEVDGADGTLRVFADGQTGPVLVSTWPSGGSDSAGWRESQPLDLEISAADAGVRIVEHCDGREFAGVVAFAGGVLSQEFESGERRGRVFQSIGLRQGAFARGGPAADPAGSPIGLGIGVRDSSEVVAASPLADPGEELTWTGDAVRITVPVREEIRLVHSTLLERRLTADPDGVARLRTVLGPVPGSGPAAGTRAPAAAGHPADQPPAAAEAVRALRMDAAAGGLVGWSEGPAKVLRSPFPRTRAFGYNPRWSAGMWVTPERDRSSRESGLGWGLRTGQAWVEKHPLGLYEPQQRIGWELTEPDGPAGPLLAHVQAPEAAEEIVLWLTPNTPRETAVLVETAGVRRELDTAGFRRLWAAAAAIRLTGDRWLECRPVDAAAGHAELVLRTTASGLLIGCVAGADGPHGADCTWRFQIHQNPPFQPGDQPEPAN